MRIVRMLGIAVMAGVVSCSDGDSSASADATPAFVPFSQRIAQDSMRSQNAMVPDEQGVWRPQVNKRSPMESQGQSAHFKGQYQGGTYTAGEYAKKSWWGNTEYQPKAYAGNTDGSRFSTNSRLQGQGAGEAGRGFGTSGYDTTGYATSGAREGSGTRLGRPENAYAESRRNDFGEPEMVDWQQQRGLSLGQTKGLRGR